MTFLEYLEANYDVERVAGGSEVKLGPTCPFCGETRRDLRLYVNLAEETGVCFHCGKGFKSVVFVMATERVSWDQAVSILNGEHQGLIPLEPEAMEEPRLETPWPKVYRARDIERAREYLEGRNVTPEMMDRFDLYYSPHDMEFEGKVYGTADRVIIPICDISGKPVSWQGRSLKRGITTKYLFPPGFESGKYLYNVHRIERRPPFVIVTEGTFHVYGWARFGINAAVGTFGKKISEEQVDLLRYLQPEKLLMAWDTDALWKKYEFCEQYGHYFGHKVFIIDLAGKDADEVGHIEALGAIRAARRYLWEDKILSCM